MTLTPMRSLVCSAAVAAATFALAVLAPPSRADARCRHHAGLHAAFAVERPGATMVQAGLPGVAPVRFDGSF
jgi:hypothetical protein